jgi:hypothetical protein
LLDRLRDGIFRTAPDDFTMKRLAWGIAMCSGNRFCFHARASRKCRFPSSLKRSVDQIPGMSRQERDRLVESWLVNQIPNYKTIVSARYKSFAMVHPNQTRMSGQVEGAEHAGRRWLRKIDHHDIASRCGFNK